MKINQVAKKNPLSYLRLIIILNWLQLKWEKGECGRGTVNCVLSPALH